MFTERFSRSEDAWDSTGVYDHHFKSQMSSLERSMYIKLYFKDLGAHPSGGHHRVLPIQAIICNCTASNAAFRHSPLL